MYTIKTKSKMLKAQFVVFMTRNRYVGSYPKLKRFILSNFLVLVIGFVGWNISLQVPEIKVTWDKGPLVIENRVQAKFEAIQDVPVMEEVKRDLIDEIFLKESSRGKNNYSKCEAIGKYNRYGFGIPGNGQYVCFEKGEDTKAVEGWVAHRKALGLSDNALLCLYNTGKAIETCDYAK